jgi:hypothetical protein
VTSLLSLCCHIHRKFDSSVWSSQILYPLFLPSPRPSPQPLVCDRSGDHCPMSHGTGTGHSPSSSANSSYKTQTPLKVKLHPFLCRSYHLYLLFFRVRRLKIIFLKDNHVISIRVHSERITHLKMSLMCLFVDLIVLLFLSA